MKPSISFLFKAVKDGDRFDLVSKPFVNLDFDGNPFVGNVISHNFITESLALSLIVFSKNGC